MMDYKNQPCQNSNSVLTLSGHEDIFYRLLP